MGGCRCVFLQGYPDWALAALLATELHQHVGEGLGGYLPALGHLSQGEMDDTAGAANFKPPMPEAPDRTGENECPIPRRLAIRHWER